MGFTEEELVVETKKNNVKEISITAHCSDCFAMQLHNDDGSQKEYKGYVPKFLGGGDDVQLRIDVATGQILNWKPPTEEELEALNTK